jgi:hypothetical protein
MVKRGVMSKRGDAGLAPQAVPFVAPDAARNPASA